MREPSRTASGLTVLTRMPCAAELLGQAARQVQLGRLRGRIGRGALPGRERVLRADEDDAAACALLDQQPRALAGDEEVAAGEDVVVAVPELSASSR